MKQFFSIRLKQKNIFEHICKSCHQALSSDKPKLPCHLSTNNLPVLFKCCICCVEHNEKQCHDFDINNYNKENSLLKLAFVGNFPDRSTAKICKQCHTKLKHHSLVTCTLCMRNIKHYSALILKQSSIDEHSLSRPNKQLICKPCNSTLVNEIKCISCDRKYPKHNNYEI